MKPIPHPSNTHVLGAPLNWDQDQLPCDPLAITKTVVEGQAALKSYWLPTEEELAILNSGGSVTLFICGFQHPPVIVSAEAKPTTSTH